MLRYLSTAVNFVTKSDHTIVLTIKQVLYHPFTLYLHQRKNKYTKVQQNIYRGKGVKTDIGVNMGSPPKATIGGA